MKKRKYVIVTLDAMPYYMPKLQLKNGPFINTA